MSGYVAYKWDISVHKSLLSMLPTRISGCHVGHIYHYLSGLALFTISLCYIFPELLLFSIYSCYFLQSVFHYLHIIDYWPC